jgi:hypothetical protein
MFTQGERVMVNLGSKSDVTSVPHGDKILTTCIGYVRYTQHIAGYGPGVSVRLELPGDGDGPMRGPARMVKASMVTPAPLPVTDEDDDAEAEPDGDDYPEADKLSGAWEDEPDDSPALWD